MTAGPMTAWYSEPMVDLYQRQDYPAFLLGKLRHSLGDGLEVSLADIHSKLYPFQKHLCQWALRRGRAAIFADCGLGKTFMQLEWARHIPGKVLLVDPLSVAQQTVSEAAKLGLEIAFARRLSEVPMTLVKGG